MPGSDRKQQKRLSAFSMIEVLLAIGVFAFAILVLLGLWAPSLSSVATLIESHQATSVISRLNAFLQTQSFQTVYRWVAGGTTPNLIAYTYTDPNTGQMFHRVLDASDAGNSSRLNTEIPDTRGAIFKITLQASDVNPVIDSASNTHLPANIDSFTEGYLALEVRVYRLPRLATGSIDTTLNPLTNNRDLLLIYNTAITR